MVTVQVAIRLREDADVVRRDKTELGVIYVVVDPQQPGLILVSEGRCGSARVARRAESGFKGDSRSARQPGSGSPSQTQS